MVVFDSRSPLYKSPFGAVRAGEKIAFSLLLPLCACCEGASGQEPLSAAGAPRLTVFAADQWDSPLADIPMPLERADWEGRLYRCVYTPEKPSLLFYRFDLGTGGALVRDAGSLSGGGCRYAASPRPGEDLWQLTVYDPHAPWSHALEGGVLYQIFPDRFYNGGGETEREKSAFPDRQYHARWGELPVYRPDPQSGEITNNDYFGGNLEGIRQKLGYLKSLGVTALYLNPIFEAHSNHRYNTADYTKIDPLLGKEEDFARLCREAAALGIRVLLDGVFSHTGSDSVYFNQSCRYPLDGAVNRPDSPYRSWYHFTRYPDRYDAWWGVKTLPETVETDPSFLEFITGEGGVIAKWMEKGASGFRLDVADELPDPALDRIAQRIKAFGPDKVVLGEVWEDASNKVSYSQRRRYLLGGQLDSVMNYPFRAAILEFIRLGDGAGFFRRILEITEHYPPAVLHSLMNPLSTHDTLRALTCLGGEIPGRPQDAQYGGDGGNGGLPPIQPGDIYAQGRDREWQAARMNPSSRQYLEGVTRLRLAMVLQYLLPGVPSIYYGDEAGMWGWGDPFNRCCYPWGGEDQPLVDFVRRLGAFRAAWSGQSVPSARLVRPPVLARGELLPLYASREVAAFLRRDPQSGAGLVAAVNRSRRAQPLPLPPGWLNQCLFSTDDDGLLPRDGCLPSLWAGVFALPEEG